MRELGLFLVIGALVVGCDDGPGPGDDAGGMDAGAGVDAGPRDGGGNPGEDSGPPGNDAGSGNDAGMNLPPATMCDPTRGIECDGDWAGRCATPCAASECCSPRVGVFGMSEFGCAPRDASGNCPAADIWVDEARIEGNYAVEYRTFGATSCSVQESCIDAPGVRRILRFDTWTPNTGDADLYLGQPGDHPDLFEFSPCHNHYHFNSYARYALVDASGNVVARGHKQAFCLLDFYAYPGTNAQGAHYTCTNQGIQAGWQDVYDRSLDCQWVDVTNVPGGDYVLRIEVNYEGVLLESNYDNNMAEIPITIPGETLTLDGPHACTPGAMVQVGCSETCGAGSCTGDPFLRVCDAAGGATSCITELGSNDDCAARCRGNGGACCPSLTVECPASGSINVFWGSFNTTTSSTCNVAVIPG